jgi:hypothetical protein
MPFSPSSSLAEEDPDWLLYTPSSSDGPSPALAGLSSASAASYAEVTRSKSKEPMVDWIPGCSTKSVVGEGPSSAGLLLARRSTTLC